MKKEFDIIDLLEAEEGYVCLHLTSGKRMYGTPMGIEYMEDEEGWETIKRIAFIPYGFDFVKDYGLEDISSYDVIEEEDIPIDYRK